MNSTIHRLPAAIAFSALVLVAVGDDYPVGYRKAGFAGSELRRNEPPAEKLGPLLKGTQVLGSEVINLQGEKLGKVQDLAVDLEGGQVLEIIISVGGFLGLGDKLVAVPPPAFNSGRGPAVILDADKTRLEAAAEFDAAHWEESLQPERLARAAREFEVYPESDDLAECGSAAMLSSERILHPMKASTLIGFPVKTTHGDSVGKVDNLLVDLHAGRLVQVVVSAGAFLGVVDELNFIPPGAFSFNADRSALVLDASKDSLSQAPRFKRDQWPAAPDPVGFAGVYHYYRVKPYFDTSPAGAEKTGRNAPDRYGHDLTPPDQGSDEADVAVTRNIRNAIRKTGGLSVNAQNVKVITRDGRVTLRGSVNSTAEKIAIAAIAHWYGTDGGVDNQLEVRAEEPVAR